MNSAHDPIRESWRNFLIEAAFAKDYKTPYVIESGGPVANNPVLDSLLPSLLIVKLASLVDEALSECIAREGLAMPKTYRTDFNGKINFLRDGGQLKDAARLHKLREFRNELAHESTGKANWKDLETAIETANPTFPTGRVREEKSQQNQSAQSKGLHYIRLDLVSAPVGRRQ